MKATTEEIKKTAEIVSAVDKVLSKYGEKTDSIEIEGDTIIIKLQERNTFSDYDE